MVIREKIRLGCYLMSKICKLRQFLSDNLCVLQFVRLQQSSSSKMDKTKKIHFKAGALTSQQLIERVQHNLAALDIALFIHRNGFKYFPHFVEQLHSSFTNAALLYSIAKRFQTLTENQNIDFVAISQQLKENYTSINLKIMKKKDSFFYFLCIYLTKLATNFLQDTFLDIMIEAHLESQLYISLVYVMIGLQVSPKSYQINHRKVITQPLSFRAKTYRMSKPSIQSFAQKTSKKRINLFQMNTKRRQSKYNLQRKPNLQKSETLTDADVFKSSLKQNLVVDALPTIFTKKFKASEFDKIAQHNQSKTLLSQSKCPHRAEGQSVRAANNIQSTQNSSSYELFFKKNDQNICNMHKTVKISHRPQLVENKSRKIQQSFETIANVEQSQSNYKQSAFDSSRKNWEKIIKNIKLNAVYTTKNNSKSLWAQHNQNQESLTTTVAFNQPTTFHYSQGQKIDNQIIQQQARVSTNGLLMRPRNLITQFYQEKEKIEESRFDRFQRQKSQKYRVQRKQFDFQCDHRQIQAAYSIFNKSNTFIKFGLTHK